MTSISADTSAEDAPVTELETRVTKSNDATEKIVTAAESNAKPAASQVTPNQNELEDTVARREMEARLAGAVVIVNPPTTGGVIHYVIDGKTTSLLPGEYRLCTANDGIQAIFHRGGDFDDTELLLDAGVFAFGVSQNGWDLTPVSGDACRRLLRACRCVE